MYSRSRHDNILVLKMTAQNAYPYVYVNEDGSVRELHQIERDDLQIDYSPGDGNRPYIKPTYDSRSAMGFLRGFCPRDRIPPQIKIAPAPIEAPNQYMTEEEGEVFMKKFLNNFEEVREPDGKIWYRRIKK